MPRRHNRDDEIPPLTITPADVEASRPRSWDEIKAEREAASERRRQRTEQRRIQRIRDAIPWTRGCLIPGCEERVFNHASTLKDPERLLPLCMHHEGVIWRQAQRAIGKPDFINVVNEQVAREQIQLDHDEAEEKRQWLERQDGDIYFLRLNGLIKVGWSRSIYQRFKAYGPDVEVLCHYPATRTDETLLHRQLRPYLAKGREWYQDCKLIEDMVANVVAQHGPPTVRADWTEPKQGPIGTRPAARSKPTGLSL